MRLDHVVLLHERLFGELPVHGQARRLPPLGPAGRGQPLVLRTGEGLDALPQWRRRVVEVDPGASAPHLAADRREVEVLRLQVVLGEGLRARHEGVGAVGAVAPAVEGADEARLARTTALDDLDPAVPARVLERPHSKVRGAHDHDRLVKDLVLDEVVGLGDLLEPAGHLPDARPQPVDLHLEEVRVVVALLGGAVGVLHGVGHRKCRPFPIRDCHATCPLVPKPLRSDSCGGRNRWTRCARWAWCHPSCAPGASRPPQ